MAPEAWLLLRVMRALVVLVSLVAVAALAACGGSSSKTTSAGSMRVKTTSADVSSLAGYTTYSHATAQNAPEGFTRGPLRPEVIEAARQDVDAELQKRGYVSADDGELVVRISSGSRVVEDQPTGAAAAVGAPATEEKEGELVIDIFERASGKQLFHGFARDVLRRDEIDERKIAKAVTKILERVPARAQ